MTQADNTHRVLGRSLERVSASPAQPPVLAPAYSPLIHVQDRLKTPPEDLPRGWKSFFSAPDRRSGGKGESSRWYAPSPWPIHKLKAEAERKGARALALKLDATVWGNTWEELKAAVDEQIMVYDQLTGL